jgi:hypothetical protein
VRWFRRPSEPVTPEPAPDPDALALPGTLLELDRFVNRSAGRLPTPAVVKARWIIDTLREILGTAEHRPLDIQALLTVRGTATDYLPTTLRNYLSVAPADRGPADRLLDEQLDTLQETATTTLTAARDLDADALATQGAFLRAKFARSELDL